MSSIISINLDSFIYAVRQAFDARNKADGVFNSHLKYTPFLENTWEKPVESAITALNQTLLNILHHHWNAIPHYQRHASVNLENISWFAHSMAAMIADIEFLVKSVLNQSLPSKRDTSEESKQIWALITHSVQTVFKDYALLFNSYVEWKYNPVDPIKETVDWNVRPPCGVLYRTEFKALFDEIRNNRFGKKTQHKGDKDSKKRDNKPSHPEKEARHHEAKHHDVRNKTAYGEKSHPKDRWKNARVSKERQEENEASIEALKAAIDECKRAIETIKGNSQIQEIPLSSQNSFIRREQHTFITESGFNSDSRGEGDDRHVCVMKK